VVVAAITGRQSGKGERVDSPLAAQFEESPEGKKANKKSEGRYQEKLHDKPGGTILERGQHGPAGIR
jgi:hypothetical protein